LVIESLGIEVITNDAYTEDDHGEEVTSSVRGAEYTCKVMSLVLYEKERD
jgi:hypothetical protein